LTSAASRRQHQPDVPVAHHGGGDPAAAARLHPLDQFEKSENRNAAGSHILFH